MDNSLLQAVNLLETFERVSELQTLKYAPSMGPITFHSVGTSSTNPAPCKPCNYCSTRMNHPVRVWSQSFINWAAGLINLLNLAGSSSATIIIITFEVTWRIDGKFKKQKFGVLYRNFRESDSPAGDHKSSLRRQTDFPYSEHRILNDRLLGSKSVQLYRSAVRKLIDCGNERAWKHVGHPMEFRLENMKQEHARKCPKSIRELEAKKTVDRTIAKFTVFPTKRC